MVHHHLETRDDRSGDGPRLITISADTETELKAKLAQLQALLDGPCVTPADLARVSQIGPVRSSHAVAITGSSFDDLRAAVARLARQHTTTIVNDRRPRLVFLFPGGGVQYPGMGRELYRHESVYRQAVDACRTLLRERGAHDVLPALLASPKDHAIAEEFRTPLHSGIGIFVHQYSMFRLLESFGLVPDEIVGHSLGEYACAVVAGALSLEGALTLMQARGSLLQELDEPGAMLLVGESEGALAGLMPGGTVAVALNGPRSTGVAGPEAAIGALSELLDQQSISNHRIWYGAASHCYLVEPLLPAFRAVLASCAFAPSSIPWTSTVTARRQPPGVTVDASYWCRQFREPVRFAEAIRAVADEGPAIFVEIGPQNGLTSLVKTIVADPKVVSFGQHASDTRDALLVMLAGIGDLWSQGATITWDALRPGTSPVRPFLAGSRRDGGRPSQSRTPSSMPELACTDIEFVVASVWQEMFDNEQIGIEDNFFDLGGHSLLAVRINSALRSLFSVQLPLESFFNDPTVPGVAEALVMAGSVHGISVEAIAATLREVSEMSDEHLASLNAQV